MKMMWSGRFREPLDPAFERWQRSFSFDCRLLAYEVAASKAHARALRNAGILSAEELASILFGLDQIKEQAASQASFLSDDEAEDVHHFIEKKLVELIGEGGSKLHCGRSRNEQIATDLRLYVRENLDRIQWLLADLSEVILDQAEECGEAVMPAYTHLQRAEPELVAHWLLAFVEMFLRDSERLSDCRKRVNICPLGSGAVVGATVVLDREAIASELGFERTTGNSVDATSDRDFAIEFVTGLAMLNLHISRWAEQMSLFSAREFGFIHLPEAYSTGSSAMPQKKNADLLELVRGKCARIIGDVTALLVTTKGLPLAYNKDLQETQEPLFHATEEVVSMLPLITGWMRAVQFDFARMRKCAETGFTNAWAAASFLAQRGVPFRRAHEAIGKAIQICLEKGCELQDLSLVELRDINSAFDETFRANISLRAVVALHDVPGGTAPDRVKEAMASARARLAALNGIAHAHA